MVLYNDDNKNILPTIADNSIDLVITSPPYWNLRAYSFWPEYELYLKDMSVVIQHLARIIKPGRHIFWVIPDKIPVSPKDNIFKERMYRPIYSDTEYIAAQSGLVCKVPIIWKKEHGKQKMFGSYPFPPTIIITPLTERICIWRKPGKCQVDKELKHQSEITKQEWIDYAKDVWEINPASNKNHPAVFPIEIPKRIIKLWSIKQDIVLDPFMGIGTTGISALRQDRQFIGIEINEYYYNLAKDNLK